jgi:hypothetical protein
MESYYSRVLLYHCITYGKALVVLAVIILCCLFNPLFVIPGLVLIVAFVLYRHGHNLQECQRRWRSLFYDDARAIELERAEEERRAKEEAVRQKVARKANAVSDMYWCLTCGYPYIPSPREIIFAPIISFYWHAGGNPLPPKLCSNSDIPKHNVFDKPPSPNIYEWWWFQCNGYQPPDFHPEATRNPFVHEGWGADNEIEAMRKAGREYYSKRPNYAWDMGCHGSNEIPDWYIERNCESTLAPSQQIATSSSGTDAKATRLPDDVIEEAPPRQQSGARDSPSYERRRAGLPNAVDAGDADSSR